MNFGPVVAGPENETRRLSNFIDILLKPMDKHVKSFIRGSTDFLNHLPKTVSPDSNLVSFDIENLYSNITHELGLEAINYWLDKQPEDSDRRIDKDFIKRGTQFILENNNFHFNGNYYKQVKGTVMGTRCAPTYATLVSGYLEEKLCNIIEDTFDKEFREYFEKNVV